MEQERRGHWWRDCSFLRDSGHGIGDNGVQFSVTVSNATGSVTSNGAALTVNAAVVAPSITSQPAGQTVTAGQTATFVVAAAGTAPLSYQWKRIGAAIGGATGESYTTPVTTTTDSGASFSVTVSNSANTRHQRLRNIDCQRPDLCD